MASVVLVAHNGFAFDFQILAAEVERHKLIAGFIEANLRFVDTLHEVSYIVCIVFKIHGF